MPLWKTPAPELAQLAAARGERADIMGTAVWHYSCENPKAKILMVHGFRGNHLGLSAIAGALADYHVAIPDLPGYNKSAEMPTTHDLDGYGLWLKNLASQLGEDWVILGHSFGSLVVSNAISRGMRCRGVVLQNPITTRSSDQRDFANSLARGFYHLTPKLGSVGSALLRSWVIVRGMSVAMTTTWNLGLRSWIHDQHARHFSCYQSDRVALEGFEAASGGSVLDYATQFNTNVLLIAGEKDSIAPLPNQILASNLIASAELKTIPKVGHLTHYETPGEVARLIDEFVGKL
jgi:pimeloyl-ACP methyl ester carboxylesterase